MENKPIVTCHGDQTLFSKLHSAVVAGLPKESIEWRRSYGRAPRKVCVEANFVPFNPDIIPGEEDWTLLGRPFFHTYWTDCDMDNYKSVVKDDIAEWLGELKTKGATDWLIIVVVNDESKVKSKLLRTSVVDKIRSEFCAKQTEKCVVLQDPLKVDARSADTWLTMLARMRQLLLASYNKNLSRFEEYMRAQRERRQEPGWNFSQYFMLQEELAFMFEMLGLYEDALVQYDELDALFTQFVLNHAAGDTAEWISAFSEMTCTSWDGLCLSQPINIDKRQLIKRNKASLLDFRNYLFSRQCMLLFLLNRPAEVAQRAIPFMHNCIQELGILEIEMPPGSVACWVFLTCLEVLQTCEKFSESMESYSLFTASLWDYARNKMHELGILCGLMPEDQTSSQQLNLVVDLISGMTHKEGDHSKADEILLEAFIGKYKMLAGLRICYDKYGESEPLEKLREALSSKESFKKHYLELSELAMGTYKHIGRIRSARLIGKDLADFYMKLGEPSKAEGFLLESLKTFKTEGWSVLADHTRLQMAQCQRELDSPERYIKSCMYVAASQVLDSTTREQHQQEVLRLAGESSEEVMVMRSRPVFSITDIQLSQSSIILQEDASVHLTITSNLLQPITADDISIALTVCDLPEKASQVEETDGNTGSSRRASLGPRISRSRHTSRSSVNDVETFDLSQYVATFVPEYLDLQDHVEKKENNRSTLSTSIVLRTSLKRMDSGPQFTQNQEVNKEDYTESLSASNVEINPGKNSVTLVGKPSKKGRFCMSQLCIQVKKLHFLKALAAAEEAFEVVCDQPSVTLQPKQGVLTAGLPQPLELYVLSGSFSFPEEENLKCTLTPGLSLTGAGLSEGTVMLPPAPPNNTQKFMLSAFADLNPDSQSDTCHQVSLECARLKEPVEVNLTFRHPLSIKHALHTAGTRKYIQIVVQSSSMACYRLTDHTMESASPDIQLTALNKPGQELEVSEDCSASYVWQVNFNTEEYPPLPCTFNIAYQPSSGPEGQSWTCRYNFTLTNYKTLYSVKSIVSPGPKADQCYSGCMCGLKLHVKALGGSTKPRPASSLMYTVHVNPTYWALAGKTTGMFQLEEDHYEAQLEVMPLMAGYLPLPSVHLEPAPPSPDTGQSLNEETSTRGEFLTGQVYNSSAATQVYVLPTPNTSHIDVTAQA